MELKQIYALSFSPVGSTRAAVPAERDQCFLERASRTAAMMPSAVRP